MGRILLHQKANFREPLLKSPITNCVNLQFSYVDSWFASASPDVAVLVFEDCEGTHDSS
jgi:hypothetical protein